jgi:hypothetical protein
MDERERLRKFEAAITGGNFIKGPEQPPDAEREPPTMAELIQQIRREISRLNTICDDLETAINASVEEAHQAAASMIAMTKRVK